MSWTEEQTIKLVEARFLAEKEFPKGTNITTIWDRVTEKIEVPSGITRKSMRDRFHHLLKKYKKYLKYAIEDKQGIEWPYFQVFDTFYEEESEDENKEKETLQKVERKTKCKSNKKETVQKEDIKNASEDKNEKNIDEIKEGCNGNVTTNSLQKNNTIGDVAKNKENVTKSMGVKKPKLNETEKENATNDNLNVSNNMKNTKNITYPKILKKQPNKANTNLQSKTPKKELNKTISGSENTNDFKILINHFGQILQVIDDVAKKFDSKSELEKRIDELNVNIKDLIKSISDFNSLLQNEKIN